MPTSEDLNSRLIRVEVGQGAVVEELRAVASELRTSNKQIAELLAKQPIVADHETRLRALEEDRWKVRGVFALCGFVGLPTLATVVFLASKVH